MGWGGLGSAEALQQPRQLGWGACRTTQRGSRKMKGERRKGGAWNFLCKQLHSVPLQAGLAASACAHGVAVPCTWLVGMG